jgi:hypothetical protein
MEMARKLKRSYLEALEKVFHMKVILQKITQLKNYLKCHYRSLHLNFLILSYQQYQHQHVHFEVGETLVPLQVMSYNRLSKNM